VLPSGPRQYRLELIGSLTGPELDVLVGIGFVEDARFRLGIAGLWHQTRLESDLMDPEADDSR